LGRRITSCPPRNSTANCFRTRTDAGCSRASISAGQQGGRILLRPGGAFGRYTRTVHVWANDPPSFEVDPATLAALDDLHERAGLLAWRDTHHAIREWDWARLYEAAELALRSAPITTVNDASTSDGVGLFDPEFGQWHFVAASEC
jgi:hypothetical protein